MREAADLLRVDLSTAHRWALRGRLAAWRRMGRLVTCRRAVEALLVPLRVPVRQTARQRGGMTAEEVIRRHGL